VDVKISNASSRDLPDILELENKFIGLETSNTLQRAISNHAFHYIIGETDGEFAGYCCYSLIADEAEIISIAVKEKFRRKKIAERLINFAIEEIKTNGGRSIFLEVRQSNTPAICLYKKAGFKHISERKEYYDCGGGRRENALVFKLDC